MFTAHVAQYVSYIARLTRSQIPVKSPNTDPNPPPFSLPNPLPLAIPLYGPRFLPPGYLEIQRHQNNPNLTPRSSYIKPVNIVHPFYYPQIRRCPRCESTDVIQQGWTSTSYRSVHGVAFEETALGYQYRCQPCSAARRLHESSNPRNFTTTSCTFWESWNINTIPRKSRNIPCGE